MDISTFKFCYLLLDKNKTCLLKTIKLGSENSVFLCFVLLTACSVVYVVSFS